MKGFFVFKLGLIRFFVESIFDCRNFLFIINWCVVLLLLFIYYFVGNLGGKIGNEVGGNFE